MSLKQRLGFTEEPLYVMDGNAFLFRGFFANSSMSRSDGFPTGALHILIAGGGGEDVFGRLEGVVQRKGRTREDDYQRKESHTYPRQVG